MEFREVGAEPVPGKTAAADDAVIVLDDSSAGDAPPAASPSASLSEPPPRPATDPSSPDSPPAGDHVEFVEFVEAMDEDPRPASAHTPASAAASGSDASALAAAPAPDAAAPPAAAVVNVSSPDSPKQAHGAVLSAGTGERADGESSEPLAAEGSLGKRQREEDSAPERAASEAKDAEESAEPEKKPRLADALDNVNTTDTQAPPTAEDSTGQDKDVPDTIGVSQPGASSAQANDKADAFPQNEKGSKDVEKPVADAENGQQAEDVVGAQAAKGDTSKADASEHAQETADESVRQDSDKGAGQSKEGGSTTPKENESSPTAAKDEKGDSKEDGYDSTEEQPLDLAAMAAFEYEQVAQLTPAQLRRYEQYRRSDLKNAKVKKVLVALNPLLQKASEQYVIAVKGLAKLFVGDVVESANEVKRSRGEKGPLQPKHLREAYRQLRKSGVVPSTADKTPFH